MKVIKKIFNSIFNKSFASFIILVNTFILAMYGAVMHSVVIAVVNVTETTANAWYHISYVSAKLAWYYLVIYGYYLVIYALILLIKLIVKICKKKFERNRL